MFASGVSLAGQWWHCWSLRRQAADLHVGEGTACLTAALRIGRTGRDNVFQPVQGDDEEGEEEEQQAEEDRKIDVDTFSATGWSRSSPSGKSRRIEVQKALSLQLSPIQLLHLGIHPRQMLTEAFREQDPRHSVVGKSTLYSLLFIFTFNISYNSQIQSRKATVLHSFNEFRAWLTCGSGET